MTASAASAPVPVDLPLGRRLDAAVEAYGRDEVVARSIALLAGANAGEEFLLWVGGRHARGVLDGAPPLYWPETWGARALLHVWGSDAAAAITAGLGNPAWRVREMCAKVVATHDVVAAAVATRPLLTDDVPRVRAAAARALGVVGEQDDIARVETLLTDADIEVRRASGSALSALKARLASY